MLDLFLLYCTSLLTFAVFGYDKHAAVFSKSRIPEWVMMLLALLDGAFGALCGMIFFKHKTQHRKFTICVPLLLFLQLAIVIVYRVFIR